MFRQIFRSNIFVKLLSAFILGLLLTSYIEEVWLQQATLVTMFTVPVLLTVYALLYLNRRYVTYKTIQACLLYACIVLGAISNKFSHKVLAENAYQEILKSDSLQLSLGGNWQASGKRFKCIARLHAESKDYKVIAWAKDTKAFEKEGTFFTANTLRRVPIALNPGDFNRRIYLERKGIFHEIQIDSNTIQRVKYRPQPMVLQWSEAASAFILQRLDSAINDTSLFNMCAALLIGYRADLDPELLRVYADSGTIHIISVSGLHVGIVFIVFSWILIYVFRIRKGFSNAIILICFVWFYALITGLPPSVVRAAAMISLGIWAKLRRFKDRGLNLLAFSALASLVWQPSLLYDIGFQLSYCAVAGIILFYKRIQSIWYPDARILILIRDTFAVSIAAQIGALPLCLLHFQQFPNYFLLGNLIAIPLSTIALYGSMALLLFSDFTFANQAIVLLLQYSISIMNFSLQWVATLPGSVWVLPINLLQVIALTMLIIALYCYIEWGLRGGIVLALLCISGMLFSSIVDQGKISTRKNIQLFQHYKYPIYLVEQGSKHQLIIDIKVPEQQRKVILAKLHRIHKKPNRVYFSSNANFAISIAGKEIGSFGRYDTNMKRFNYVHWRMRTTIPSTIIATERFISNRPLPHTNPIFSTAKHGFYQIDL